MLAEIFCLLQYLYDVYYSNEFSFPKNKPTNNATKIKFDANIRAVQKHCRIGFKVIYILIVYCFYGRKAAVGIESGQCMTLQESALSIQALFPQMNTGRREQRTVNLSLLKISFYHITVCCSAFTDWRSDECQNQHWCVGEFLLKNLIIQSKNSRSILLILSCSIKPSLVRRRIVLKDM